MSSEELAWLSGYEMAAQVRARTVSPIELVEAVLERLDDVEPEINAFVTVTADAARKQAAAAEALIASGDAGAMGPLFGVPVTVKDLTDTAGVRTTYGSMMFADHVPKTDGVSWSRMKAAGAILIGKTTTPEFGGLGVTESGLTGITSNPWRATHTSGGSSGGAAASVAAGVGALAWGSDGGGSIRVPAACCGVVGLKASRGRIPIHQAWDTVSTEGPLTRTVLDTALLLSVTAGHHPSDPLSLPSSTIEDYVAMVLQDSGLAGKRIAFVPSPADARVDHDVAEIVRRAVLLIERDGGARVDEQELRLPDPIDYFLAYWTPAMALESPETNDQGVAATTNPTMLMMQEMGRKLSATDYFHTSVTVRAEISAEYERLFAHHELIITPTMPVTAFPHPGEAAGNTHINGVPVTHPFLDFHRLTESPSHAGLPAITVPCGFSPEGLPVGLQIIGPHFADGAVLAAAAAFERLQPWAGIRPLAR